MSLDRSGTYDHLTSPPPTGLEFLEQYGSFVDALIDTSVLRLANVAGTADAITATAEPFAVPGTGLVTGMKFTLVPASNNTGAATLDIDGRGAQSIVSGDGSTLNADELVSGTRYILEFDGTIFVIIGSGAGAESGGTASRTVFDATAVWTNSVAPDARVVVELWSAGDGGESGGGGSGGTGGSYATRMFRAGDLPSSVTITIPSSAAVDAVGGDATFGSILAAVRSFVFNSTTSASGDKNMPGAFASFSGATSGFSGNGFSAIVSGGGGAGNANGGSFTGGFSIFGGNGGDTGAAGQRPGGGGGHNAVGGAGRCIITVFGG